MTPVNPAMRWLARSAVAAIVFAAVGAGAATAQQAPQPPAPPPQAPLYVLPAPPVPVGVTARAIGDAYNAIGRASIVDPSAALRAQFAYRLALSRLQMGDKSAAAAYAASAQAIAGSSGAASPVAPAMTVRASAGLAVPPAVRVPLVDAPLPGYILTARDKVWAAQTAGADVRSATARLRDAIDAYVNGDDARARREAAAAVKALPAK